jgi:hypothetical protein
LLFPQNPQNPQNPINWDDVFTLAQIHKLTPLVWHELKQHTGLNIPAKVSQHFQASCDYNIRKAMLEAAELVKVINCLEADNIRVLSIKGAVLAARGYGNLGLRHAGDIDLLLMNPEQTWQADQCVRELGYQPYHPGIELTPRQKKAHLQYGCDLVYMHKTRGTLLELHFKWNRNSGLFPLDMQEVWNLRESVNIANIQIACLNDSHHLLYLFAHGAKHAWFRLKWLCDIPPMMQRIPGAERERFFAMAADLGISEMVAQGLILANRFLDMPLPVAPMRLENPHLEYLIRVAEAELVDPDKDTLSHINGFARVPALLKKLKYAFSLRTDFQYKRKQIMVYFNNIPNWKAFPLSDFLFPLYYIFLPFFWFVRQLKSLANKGNKSAE